MVDSLDRLTAALAGRYAIDRELGRGASSTVYLATDLRHDRPVALKVLNAEVGSALGPERFHREIRIAARLAHPHILPLLDSGNADGSLFYTMPYVDGESLRQRLNRETQLPLDDAIRIARDVADGLAYAHVQGIVHRDIKPENILLEAGHAVVADFGIARALDSASGQQLTGAGAVVGTPAYMSPEQAAGGHDLDGRSDLYSLGCVLFEMLAGLPPFTGPNSASVIHQHLAVSPPSVSSLRPVVPKWMDDLVSRSLAKTRADRMITAAEFAKELETQAETSSAEGGSQRAEASSVGTRLVTDIPMEQIHAIDRRVQNVVSRSRALLARNARSPTWRLWTVLLGLVAMSFAITLIQREQVDDNRRVPDAVLPFSGTTAALQIDGRLITYKWRTSDDSSMSGTELPRPLAVEFNVATRGTDRQIVLQADVSWSRERLARTVVDSLLLRDSLLNRAAVQAEFLRILPRIPPDTGR